MKKFLLLMFTFIFAFALVACGGDESTAESEKETVSVEESVSESQKESQEPASEEHSEEQSEESQSEEQSEPVVETYTITFVVNVDGVEAPESITVEEGDVVTLPVLDIPQLCFKYWVIEGTDTIFEDGEFTHGADVVLVAVFDPETGIH